MTKLRALCLTVSLDGYLAGPNQTLEQPMGEGAQRLHPWMFATRTAQRVMFGKDGGDTGIDDRFVAVGFDEIGATIMGRNMFGPVRGEWPDESWRGWWGEEPVYHHPVFVLTHHARPDLVMEGGTTFHFVTGGIQEAYDRAMAAAGDLDVRLGGGASTVRQYLDAALVDELHLVVVPILLGGGERVLDGPITEASTGLHLAEMTKGDAEVTHVRFVR